MANKKNMQREPAPRVPAGKPVAPSPVAQRSGSTLKTQLLIAGAVAVVTWLFLQVCTGNQLTNWDDPGYIKENELIKNLSSEGLRRIFSTSVMGNYHPLTILSYAIEYSYVGLEPRLYHIDSLLLHIVVTLLVFWFVSLLTKRPLAGAVTALLFGLHPMHMESVAWLAGRKDVVYGAFFVGACIAWVYYLRAEKGKRLKWLLLVAFLFLCSLLAKPVAVTLPLCLLLIDYWEKRSFLTPEVADASAKSFWQRIDYNALTVKLPFFAISFGFGLKSIKDQDAFDALLTQNVVYSVVERIILGSYAFVTYLWKAVVPVGLSCFYPYPTKVQGGTFPPQYFAYPLIAAALLFVLFRFAKKNRVVMFGSLFFLVNILLLLQFIPVGGAIIADRYSYISYLGLFFIAGWYVSVAYESAEQNIKSAALIGTALYIGVLGYLGRERCLVWYDTTSLWRDEIEKQPEAPNAYNNLGFNYFNRLNESVNQAERKVFFDSSYQLLTKAISLQKDFANPYVSLGELFRAVNRFPEAKVYYYEALKLHDKNGDANAYLGLGIIYAMSHNFDSAETCFRLCVASKSYFPEAHSNFGNFFDMTRRPDSALREYGIALSQNPDMYAAYLNRARLQFRLGHLDEALTDFNHAIERNPTMGEIYYFRSYVYNRRGDKGRALQDVQQAATLGYPGVDKEYFNSLKQGH